MVIIDPSVIGSARETTFDPKHPSGTNARGAWSFGRLIHNMLPKYERRSAAAASRLVMNWLKTWEVDQAPNPSVSPAKARTSIRMQVINPWKEASGCGEPESPATDASCVLDMAQAPFRLLAIVNRPDLRILSDDETAIGGEGRFVFQLVGPTLGVNSATSQVEVMHPHRRASEIHGNLRIFVARQARDRCARLGQALAPARRPTVRQQLQRALALPHQ
jgi:hypothetical protein